MKTAIQHLIHSFENDRMQSTYTKEQILNLLNFKLQQEKDQIVEAHGNKLKKSRGAGTSYEYWVGGEQYYNETFKS